MLEWRHLTWFGYSPGQVIAHGSLLNLHLMRQLHQKWHSIQTLVLAEGCRLQLLQIEPTSSVG